jgi:hypothetical protein
MLSSGSRDYKIEPEYLGPLQDRPLAETARSGGPSDLFPGASEFLSARHQRRRREQWNTAKPLARLLLRPEEHLLYVAHGMQIPPVLHSLALGAMALPYHQVVLLFTDTHLIEIMLSVRGKSAGTRVRSFPWAAVRDIKLTLAKMRVEPADGKRQEWRLPLRGDRKFLKLLMPRLKQRCLQGGTSTAQSLPLWHCPKCGATVAVKPKSCEACRTTFRSPKLAALLSLAFPGAGLFYAGHPFLAAMDCLGEVVLYLLFLLMMIQSEPGAVISAVGFGAILFLLTKLESVHLSQILVARTKPESQTGQSAYSRLAMVGGFASLLIIGSAFPLAGAARPVLDRDLDIQGEESLWVGSRNVAEWDAFKENEFARSQWDHPSGIQVTLLAYPQSFMDTPGDFRSEFRQEWVREGITLVKDDEDIPAPFKGFRLIGLTHAKDGRSVSMIQYFVMDEANHDLHQATAAVLGEDTTMADELMRDLLAHARWINRTPPEHPQPAPGS